MYTGKTLFSQIMDFLPWKTFHGLVSRYEGDRRVRTLRCAEPFRVLAFAQRVYRERLRELEACLSAQSAKLYHWAFARPSNAPPWPMPTSVETGGSSPSSRCA